MKSYIQLTLIGIIIFILAACGSGGTDRDNDNAKNDKDTITLKVAGQNNEEHPNIIALKKMADTVAEKTDGRIEMDIYHSNQLGDYTLMYEEIGQGTVDMGLISAPTHMDSRLEINILPYLLKNYEEAKEQFSLDAFYGKKIQEIHSEQNIETLGFFGEGFGGIGTTKEIKDPLDYGANKDILLRVPSVNIMTETMKNLGFSTSTLPYAELYTALQSGTVEGWTGGHAPINYLQFGDVITHYYQYNDFFEATHLLINQDVFDGLSEEDQQIIQEASNVLTEESFETAEKQEIEYRKKMKESGIEVYEFTNEEIDELSEKVIEESWPIAEESIGADLLEEVTENFE